ncbi:MAG: hypothetical protein QM758_06540 [Armatimonas sp.]
MQNKGISAAAMLDAEELQRLWATSEDYTLYCGPGTEREAAILKARYPRHCGRIELGIRMKPGTMAITKETAVAHSGVLPSSLLLG